MRLCVCVYPEGGGPDRTRGRRSLRAAQRGGVSCTPPAQVPRRAAAAAGQPAAPDHLPAACVHASMRAYVHAGVSKGQRPTPAWTGCMYWCACVRGACADLSAQLLVDATKLSLQPRGGHERASRTRSRERVGVARQHVHGLLCPERNHIRQLLSPASLVQQRRVQRRLARWPRPTKSYRERESVCV
jgi:hypothetical protein